MKQIRPHPQLPFIKIGKYVDPVFDEESFGSLDREDKEGWSYTIDGLPGFAVHQSALDALLAAEKVLFYELKEIAQSKLDRAIEENDLPLALSIAERRGFWLGVTDQRRTAAKVIEDALSRLNPLVRI